MGCSSSNSIEVVDNSPQQAPQQSSPHRKRYRLFYFEATGRAEVTRLIFVATKTPFEDIRIPKPNWEAQKSKMPLGQVPVLQVDDKPMICQSLAIARFAAKEVGLAGKSNLEMAKIDAVVDTLAELFEEFGAKLYPQIINPTTNKLKEFEKDQVVNDFAQNIMPKYFERFESLIKIYGDQNTGHFVGNELTWADLLFHEIATNLSFLIGPSILQNYQLLTKNRETVSNLPNLKEYFERRK